MKGGGTVFVLKSPDGTLISDSVRPDAVGAWFRAFDIISIEYPGFRARYWKRWSESRRWARRRGWRIVRARLVEVKP